MSRLQIANSLLAPIAAIIATSQAFAFEPFIETDFIDLQAIQPGAEYGNFGTTLAVLAEARILLVAAPSTRDPDDSGVVDGSVFSFYVDTEGNLQFEQTLEPSDRNSFGTTLAASDDWAAMGESGDKVHLFRRSGNLWTPAQLLRINSDVPATPGITVRRLDASAAMDGDLLAVGDVSTNVVFNGGLVSNAGSVVLFRRGGDNVWRHEATLIAPQPVAAAEFGEVVALSGNTLLVGAPNDAAPGGGKGGAYLFQLTNGTWGHTRTLRNPVIELAEFGWSVALDGDLAIVGCATCGSDPVFTNTGSFFSFERNLGGGNNWGLRGEFMSSTPDFIDEFSASLFLSGDRLLVGAPNKNFATLFLRPSSGIWSETDRLSKSATENLFFGTDVVLFDNHAIVGAPRWPNTSTSARWGAVSAWLQPIICPGTDDGIFCDGFED